MPLTSKVVPRQTKAAAWPNRGHEGRLSFYVEHNGINVMTDYDLTQDELETLALFQSPIQPLDIDPHHFAKLLSLALVEQKEGGPELTTSGLDRLNSVAAGKNGR